MVGWTEAHHSGVSTTVALGKGKQWCWTGGGVEVLEELVDE
jgi:hypothetical protein